MGDVWTAIDFETANRERGSACSVGLVRVEDGRIVDRYATLVKPPKPVDYFARFNIEFHGIAPEHVADAPEWPEVYGTILEFAGGGPFVAHNAAFDMGVMRAACAHTGLEWPAVDYACSLHTARRTWPGLSDHRLPTVCGKIGHALLRHHAADADAEAAAHIMIAALDAHGVATLPELCARTSRPLLRTEALPAAAGPVPTPVAVPVRADRPVRSRFQDWQDAAREPLPEPNTAADPSGPLFGRTVCVSGDLGAMSKIEAWKRVAAAGGTPAKNVTKKTDILVTGAAGGPKTAKHRQAEAYIAKGQRIDIIDERELLARLARCSASEARSSTPARDPRRGSGGVVDALAAAPVAGEGDVLPGHAAVVDQVPPDPRDQ